MRVKPLSKHFFFKFANEFAGGKFIEKSGSSIILTNQAIDTQHAPRWAEIIEVGPDVKNVEVGDIVLLDAMKWTRAIDFDNMKFWKSDDDQVLCKVDRDEAKRLGIL